MRFAWFRDRRGGRTALNLESLMELVGETAVLAAGGLLIGMFFGAFAQMSKFCLRSAVIEFSSGLLGIEGCHLAADVFRGGNGDPGLDWPGSA